MNASQNQNQPYTRDEDIARELSELFTCGDKERRNRIHALGLTEFSGAMRLLQQIHDALIEYSDQWQEAYTWGRGGIPWPDQKSEDERPDPEGESFSVAANRAADALAGLVDHAGCPQGLHTEVNQLMCNLENEYGTLPLDIRSQFAALAEKAAERESERRALQVA